MRTPPREDEPFRRRASRDCRPLPPPFPPSAARAAFSARGKRIKKVARFPLETTLSLPTVNSRDLYMRSYS